MLPHSQLWGPGSDIFITTLRGEQISGEREERSGSARVNIKENMGGEKGQLFCFNCIVCLSCLHLCTGGKRGDGYKKTIWRALFFKFFKS